MTFPQKLFILSVKLLSKLPWRILYCISDFLALVLYFVVGYRKKVVYENLNNSFPDKSKKEIRKIIIQYYRHISDIIIETLCEEKIMPNLIQHINFKERELIDRLYKSGKSIMFVGGHLGNWEWVGLSGQALGLDSYRLAIESLLV